MKKSMFYVMNVDWNWIKQRPHYIVEELAKKYNLIAVYRYRYGRKGYQKRPYGNINMIPIYGIPHIDNYKHLQCINKLVVRKRLKHLINKYDTDILYTTKPEHINYINPKYKGMVIYDCMDNYLAFPQNCTNRETIFMDESKLIKRADIILASSQVLKEELIKRYHREDIEIVRNGYGGDILQIEPTCSTSEIYTFCYFGTIATWFNFDYVSKSLEDFMNIQYLLIGPLDHGVQVPNHPRIKYIGTVEHDKLQEVTKDVDCFIMPFYVNELIKSVDPVKLYEYINFNRNILTVKYPEIDRFDPFVYFYNDYDEFHSKIKTMLENRELKYSAKQRAEFLKENTWTDRVNMINKLIEQRRR